jgi:hypothetical protein
MGQMLFILMLLVSLHSPSLQAAIGQTVVGELIRHEIKNGATVIALHCKPDESLKGQFHDI